MPAMKSLPTDVSVHRPYTTIGMLGGIMMANVPADESDPVASRLS